MSDFSAAAGGGDEVAGRGVQQGHIGQRAGVVERRGDDLAIDGVLPQQVAEAVAVDVLRTQQNAVGRLVDVGQGAPTYFNTSSKLRLYTQSTPLCAIRRVCPFLLNLIGITSTRLHRR